MIKTITIFGYGYVSKFLMQTLNTLGWNIICTSRSIDLKKPVEYGNIKIINFLDPKLPSFIRASHIILSTVPPNKETIDPVLQVYAEILLKEKFEWIGYLSSTGVYGNHDGNWVDENTICSPSNEKSRIRLLAENQWLDCYLQYKLPIHILRLSGIYGPGRNCLEQIKNGKDFTITKKGQYFSRIHIVDICRAIIASINFPTAGEIYNVSDDEPAPISQVQQFGASLLNKNNLKAIPFEDADLSEQAKNFFNDNKKVSNHKIKERLNIQWQYPNYHVGLLAGYLRDS